MMEEERRNAGKGGRTRHTWRWRSRLL